MTALHDKIATRIRREGPISLADYMSLALLHPEEGYYSRRDPLGRAGDFVTAPEVSQMFGELIGLWCADYWDRIGRPTRFSLIELGPGRGTLMVDALRAASRLPGFLDAMQLILLEASPALRALQKERLGAYRPQWIASISELESESRASLLIANEFFDALPIRQYTRRNGTWHENQVGLADDGHSFRIAISREAARHSPLLDRLYPHAPEGTVAELSNASLSLTHEIALQLCRSVDDTGGAALIIDYGYHPSQPRASFQAVKAHQRHNPLDAPGEADLTAHVNFEALLTAAAEGGASTWGPVGQGDFLTALGIDQRVAALETKATEGQRREIESARHRLTDPSQMGVLFKAVALTAPNAPPPAGFPNRATEENAGTP